MKIRMPSLRRARLGFGAALLAVATVMPTLMPAPVFAAQLSNRSIMMSSSAASAQNVTYQIKFTPSNTATAIGGILIDFCSNSPVIGTACSAPGGFSVGTPTATIAATGFVDGEWTEGQGAVNDTLEYKHGTSDAPGGEITITLTTVTNPSAVGTFYARILTYATPGAVDSYDDETPGTHIDDGGVALSTASQVSVSGTVQETLTFCVYGEAIADGCDAQDPPTLVLGHGSPIETLDSTAIDTADAYSQVSTNAGGGVSIRMRNSNSCGGLSKNGGTACEIAPANAGNATTPEAFTNGEAKFGMRAASDDGDLDVQAPYTSGTDYGMAWDDNDVTGVTSPYGSVVASSTTVLDNANTTYTFAAGASNTTPAGLYTATMTLIATGTY